MVDISASVQFNLPKAIQKWQTDLLNSFPLPAAADDQCRDTFLKDLLEPYQPSEEATGSLKSDESFEESELSDPTNWNALLYRKTTYLRKSEKRTTEPRISNIVAPDIFELMKGRFNRVTSAVGYISMLLELTNIQHRLKRFYDTCRLNVSMDKSFNIFSWSTEHYFNRFNLPNVAYLDAIDRELNRNMNCYKFRVDICEIMRLFTAVQKDVRNKRDICENSMMLIKDAQIDIDELVTTVLDLTEKEHFNVALTAIGILGRSADPGNFRKIDVHSKINHEDFVFPIEARYRLNWTQAQVDQAVIHTNKCIEQTTKELNKVKKDIEESEYLAICREASYDAQISELKHRLQEMEKTYEQRMNVLENEQTVLRHKLLDAQQTLVSNRARVGMFHVRIEEMLQFFAQQKAESRAEITKLETIKTHRKSKKKSVNGPKKKSITGKKTTKKRKSADQKSLQTELKAEIKKIPSEEVPRKSKKKTLDGSKKEIPNSQNKDKKSVSQKVVS
ncbi:uncharacterized protein LOC132786756 [Drosophila nasuta]|uniref:uncharacterized protein LOC132786756 n=1 Tax=Drosophila nasuta TaxID=42062 RepID=UPI00295E8400|nr:uncharacterized protein LOC132786756 [Drosophila nasuta]